MSEPIEPAAPVTMPIVSGEWLEEHLGDPSVRIVEVCSIRQDTTYRQGHIPGAIWWYWKDWCWHDSDREFVTPKSAARRLGALGIGADTTLVFYGDPVQHGAYAAWAYIMAGHADVRLLDGTRTKWIAEGRPLTTDIPEFATVDYQPREGVRSSRIGRDDIRAGLGQPGRVLLDARSPEEYRGERVMPPPDFDHGAERTGRIPGAVHLYFRDILNDDDSFMSRDGMEAVFAGVGLSPRQTDEIVVYCRLSHRACLVWIAMSHILGFGNVRIYDGSWTEWGSIVGFPVEK
jgi:thiosulfate/3-mercaptopyruvate sulfurtransferase